MHASLEAQHGEGLKKDALPFTEVLGQSVANIAPTLTPAVNLAFVYSSAGNGSWFTYLVATVGLVLIGLCINQFARRSATPGSLYSYASGTFGPNTGFMIGWGLLLAYLTTGIAVTAGCAMYAQDLSKMAGFNLPAVLVFAIVAASVWAITYRDVRLSARAMLALEAISVSAILILGFFVLKHNGFAVDHQQLQLKGLTGDGLRTGLVLGIFSYVGFESATAMGGEAKNPLRSVPRAVIMSTVLAGVFFMIMSYIMVQGFHGTEGTANSLDKVSGPMIYLSKQVGIPALGAITSLGGVISFFACAMACATAASRIMLVMARDGFMHANVGKTHSSNETPHIAATISAIALFVVPLYMLARGYVLNDIYGTNGTIATYGFLVAYVTIAVGSVLMLSRQGKLTFGPIAAAVAGVAMMGLAIYGSVIPYPAAPLNVLPPVFAIYMIIGAVWLLVMRGNAIRTAEERRSTTGSSLGLEAEGAA